jgi:hypothetical protein
VGKDNFAINHANFAWVSMNIIIGKNIANGSS